MLIGLLFQLAATPAFMRSPDLFGDQVVYTCEGDLWLGNLGTGRAIRLTRDVGTELNARFSPDGSMIAYDAELDGIREIYVMPTEGGAPKRLTYLSQSVSCVDWRDLHTVVFRSTNYPSNTAPAIYTVDTTGAEPVRMPLEFASSASFAADGNRFAFTRYQRFTNAWFRYQGGLKNPLWVGNLKALSFRQVHEGPGSCEFPLWLGNRIYFLTQENGDWLMESIADDGGAARKETLPSDFELRYLQGDGSRLVYEQGQGIAIFDPASRKAQKLEFRMTSDLLHTRPYMVPAEASVHSSSLGPTGKRVLVESRGQIISLPVKEGDARVVFADDGVRYRFPVYSPDGKKIACFGDESGEMQLYVGDSDGSNLRQLTHGVNRQLRRIAWAPDSKSVIYTTNERGIRLLNVATGEDKLVYAGGPWGWNASDFDWSPDSKWIAVGDVDLWTGVTTIVLVDVASGKAHRIGVGQVDDFSVRFSRDGKTLAFLSRRNLEPTGDPIQNHLNLNRDVKAYLLVLSKDEKSPLTPKADEEGEAAPPTSQTIPPPASVRIDVEGLYGRFVELPIPPGAYNQLETAADRILVHEANDNEIRVYDLKARKTSTLATAAPSMQVSADGKKVLIGAGNALRTIDASGENEARVDFRGLQLRIEPTAEWREMYWDAWRLIRDYFYVRNMHGADWKAIGKKYAALLPSVRSRDELDVLIRWMQGDLSISHSFLSTGDVRSLVRPARPSFLGADLEPTENGFYRIAKIFHGEDFAAADRSPLAEPGMNVSEGDYLISVGGRPAKVGSPWREALLGRAGQLVAIKVNKVPSETGSRTITIRPCPDESRMRWWEWVEGRKHYVDKASGGKIAYVYLRAMSAPDMADFIRQYYPQRNRGGLIVDTRFNTGGFVSDYIITVLKQRVLAFWNQRNVDVPWTRQGDFFPGPMACLENEFNYSDGEEFPFYFKAMKLGPVIGRRTRGGEVGSDPGWVLADGGVVNVPNYGMFTPEKGWAIEGHGVDPDIEVLSDPNAWAKGTDTQLDKAIELVLAEMKARPFRRPSIPPDPLRIKGGAMPQ